MEIRKGELKRTATGIERKKEKGIKKDAEREKRRTKKRYQKVRGQRAAPFVVEEERKMKREKGA